MTAQGPCRVKTALGSGPIWRLISELLGERGLPGAKHIEGRKSLSPAGHS